MHPVDRGESAAGTTPDELVVDRRPLDDRYFIPTADLVKALAGLPPIDYKQFREDIDAYVDQDPAPRFWGDE